MLILFRFATKDVLELIYGSAGAQLDTIGSTLVLDHRRTADLGTPTVTSPHGSITETPKYWPQAVLSVIECSSPSHCFTDCRELRHPAIR